MTKMTRREQAALAAMSDEAIERDIAALEADPNSKVKASGHWKLKIIRRLDTLVGEQTRRRNERHAAAVAAMGDDVQALSAYFCKHGDTQSHDALERLGYWNK